MKCYVHVILSFHFVCCSAHAMKKVEYPSDYIICTHGVPRAIPWEDPHIALRIIVLWHSIPPAPPASVLSSKTFGLLESPNVFW